MKNLPNILSVFRIFLVPVFVIIFFSSITDMNYWAAGVFALAHLTDILDGFIARRWNLITKLGRLLDPLADKLMAFTVLVCIVISNKVLWWAAALFFVKECLMGIGALVLYKRIDDVPSSNWVGKTSTFFFFCTSVLIMVVPSMSLTIVNILLIISVILSYTAFTLYCLRFNNLSKAQKGI